MDVDEGYGFPPKCRDTKWMEKRLRMMPTRGFHHGTFPRCHEEWFSPLDGIFIFTIFLLIFFFLLF